MKLKAIGPWVALLLALRVASAEVIIDLPPPATTTSVIGTTQYNAIAFTLADSFTNVAIEASLTSSAAADTATAYLTTALGAGATSADLVAQTGFTFVQAPGATIGYVSLFSNLALPADDYFLVFGAPISGSGSIEVNGTLAYTTHTSASVGAMMFSSGANLNAAFPPASGWNNSGTGNRYFRVTGDLVPEPSSLSLLGIAALFGLSRRRS